MKKQILITLFLLCSYFSHSQVLIALLLGDKLNTGKIEFGIDGGLNYSSIAGLETHKRSNSFFLGFYFDIKMKDQWLLNTGLLVKSTLGADELTEADLNFLGATIHDFEGVYTQKFSSFLVPILIKHNFKNHFYIEAGPQIGWIYKSWIEYDYELNGNTALIKENNKDIINWFDMGVSGGVGYRLLDGLGWTIGLRYYYGFTNVYKNKSGTTNSSLFLKLNIPFGVSEEKKIKIQEQKDIVLEKKTKKKEARKKKREQSKINK